MRIDIGRGCTGFPEHLHTETMGWPPEVTSWLYYTTWGAPLTIRGVPHEIHPGLLLGVRADTPHGVLPSDGMCPVTGLPRTCIIVTPGVPPIGARP